MLKLDSGKLSLSGFTTFATCLLWHIAECSEPTYFWNISTGDVNIKPNSFGVNPVINVIISETELSEADLDKLAQWRENPSTWG